jgi:hypothetical protein
MIGLRWKIGPDWPSYRSIFNTAGYFSFAQDVARGDPGYMALNWTFHSLGLPFWSLNLVAAIVFVSGLTAFCARQPNPWLAYLVALPYMIIVVGMSGTRQSMALGFLFFALNAFERGRLNYFVGLLLVGGLFHGSVLLMLPICLLSYTRNRLQSALLLAIAGAIVLYYYRDAFDIYVRRYSSVRIQSTGVVYRLAMNGLAAVIFLLLQSRMRLPEHTAKLWRNVSLLSLALAALIALVPSTTAVDRFLLYLFPLQFVVLSHLPNVLSRDGHAAPPVTIGVIGYAALVQMTFLTWGNFSRFYVPYQSIFGTLGV